MKKVIFAILAVIGLVACDPTVQSGKCSDVAELQEAIVKGSSDTARYDLNGDGEINIADINFLLKSQAVDSVAVESNDSI
jgi:hypothetical protein